MTSRALLVLSLLWKTSLRDLVWKPGLAFKQPQACANWMPCTTGRTISNPSKSTSAVGWGKMQHQIIAFWCYSVEALNGKIVFFFICLIVILKAVLFHLDVKKKHPGTDLPDQLQGNIDGGAVTAPAAPTDIICLVKRYMGSEHLSQRPLLVMTASRASRIGMVPATKIQGCTRDHPQLIVYPSSIWI